MPPAINVSAPVKTSREHYQWIQKVYVMLDDYDRMILEEYHLNTSQYRTLLLLDDERGERLTTISDRLLLSKSTITRVIDELEYRNWVKRIPDPEDRRALRVVLTPLGLKKKKIVCDAHQQALDEVFQTLDRHQQEQLDGLLKSLYSCLQLSMDGNLTGN